MTNILGIEVTIKQSNATLRAKQVATYGHLKIVFRNISKDKNFRIYKILVENITLTCFYSCKKN